jgi:hypothetical protein
MNIKSLGIMNFRFFLTDNSLGNIKYLDTLSYYLA